MAAAAAPPADSAASDAPGAAADSTPLAPVKYTGTVPAGATLEFVTCEDSVGTHRVALTRFAPAAPTGRLPVLCVHGLTRNSSDFHVLAKHLVERCGREVALLDVAGRGHSDRLAADTDYGYPQYVKDAVAVVKHLGWTRFHWVGTSMGGLIGFFYSTMPAAVRPGAVAALVMNDIGPQIPKEALERIGAYVGTPRAFSTLDDAEAYFRASFAPFAPMSDADWRYMATQSLWEVEAKDGAAGSTLVPAYDLRIVKGFERPPTGFADVDLWGLFPLINAGGLLVLRGALSDLLPDEVAQRMVLPESTPLVHGPRKLFVEPSAGHVPSIQVEEHCTEVAAFLDAADASTEA